MEVLFSIVALLWITFKTAESACSLSGFEGHWRNPVLRRLTIGTQSVNMLQKQFICEQQLENKVVLRARNADGMKKIDMLFCLNLTREHENILTVRLLHGSAGLSVEYVEGNPKPVPYDKVCSKKFPLNAWNFWTFLREGDYTTPSLPCPPELNNRFIYNLYKKDKALTCNAGVTMNGCFMEDLRFAEHNCPNVQYFPEFGTMRCLYHDTNKDNVTFVALSSDSTTPTIESPSANLSCMAFRRINESDLEVGVAQIFPNTPSDGGMCGMLMSYRNFGRTGVGMQLRLDRTCATNTVPAPTGQPTVSAAAHLSKLHLLATLYVFNVANMASMNI